MSANGQSSLVELLRTHEADLLVDWTRQQRAAPTRRDDLIREADLREQCREFLALLSDAASKDSACDVQTPAWEPVRDMLRNVAETRAQQGFTPTEVATFIFSLKQPLFSLLRQEAGTDADRLANGTWAATALIDKLGLFTIEVHQKAREDVIQQDMLELSTPVVKLWDGILALPMIGTLDSGRTQVVMESLLNRIVETGAEIAILDITGVPTVDTLVAQHLIKTVTAARLMGADCIISGIRPQIAQTIVHLGVDLKDVITKATLADAFAIALRRRGMRVAKAAVATGMATGRDADVDRIPILRMGDLLLVTIQVDMHDRLAMTLQDDLTTMISATARTGRADRHLGAGRGGLVHRPDAGQHRPDVAGARRPDGRDGHATGGGDHAGGTGHVVDGRPHGPDGGPRHGHAAADVRRAGRASVGHGGGGSGEAADDLAAD